MSEPIKAKLFREATDLAIKASKAKAVAAEAKRRLAEAQAYLERARRWRSAWDVHDITSELRGNTSG